MNRDDLDRLDVRIVGQTPAGDLVLMVNGDRHVCPPGADLEIDGTTVSWRPVDPRAPFDPAALRMRRDALEATITQSLAGHPDLDRLSTLDDLPTRDDAVDALLLRASTIGLRCSEAGHTSAEARFGGAAERAERDAMLRDAALDLMRRNPAVSEREVCRRIGKRFDVSRETVRKALKKN